MPEAMPAVMTEKEQRGKLLLLSAEDRCRELSEYNPELAEQFWIQCRYRLMEELDVGRDDLLAWWLDLEQDEIELEDFGRADLT